MKVSHGRRVSVLRVLFACSCPGFKSYSNLRSGCVSSCPRFNPAALCKTGCLLPVGVLNDVSVQFKLCSACELAEYQSALPFFFFFT